MSEILRARDFPALAKNTYLQRLLKARRLCLLRDELIKWGGLPPVWQIKEEKEKIAWLRDYKNTYLERDLMDLGGFAELENIILVQKLLTLRTGGLLNISEIAKEASLSVNTVKKYLNLLKIVFQCLFLQPFSVNVSKRLVKTPKVYVTDNGLIRSILGEGGVSARALYETWIFSELIKWKNSFSQEGELYFYRTHSGAEIDFILKMGQRLLPIEARAKEVVSQKDARNIERFLSEFAQASSYGIVVYQGKEMYEIKKNIWAIPDWILFS